MFLQAGNVAGDLHCFFTRAGFQEATLGMPLRFTVNPRLRAVDQIEASPDLVSLEAFHIGLVTKDLDHQAAQAVLPMYITAEHFERVKAGKSLQQALQKLMPGSGSLSPAAWVETMPKLLNTAVLLLMDKVGALHRGQPGHAIACVTYILASWVPCTLMMDLQRSNGCAARLLELHMAFCCFLGLSGQMQAGERACFAGRVLGNTREKLKSHV